MKLIINESFLKSSIEELHRCGAEDREGFALFLGKRNVINQVVSHIYIPEYISGPLFYKITQKGNEDLMNFLKEKKLMVLAQIHSHPEKAFHSQADDEMATVSHVGGLSFVLPYFGKDVNTKTFKDFAKVYSLEIGGRWVETLPNRWEVINGCNY